MSDLHERFGDWLQSGARANLPRDVALHASGCDVCLRHAAALDGLLGIDLDGVPLPALRESAAPARTAATVQLGRFAVGAVVVGVLTVAAFARVSAPPDPGSNPDALIRGGSPIPRGEGTLGEANGPSKTPSVAPDASDGPASADASPAAPSSENESPPTAIASPVAPAQTPSPTFGGGPPVVTSRPTPTAPPATPKSSPSPTATAVVTPGPTPTVTPTPTPTPTPSPTCDLEPGCFGPSLPAP